jgi:hypothetical protein
MMRKRIALICIAIVFLAVCVVVAHHHKGTDFSRSCAICVAAPINFDTTNNGPDIFHFRIIHASILEPTLTPPGVVTTPALSRAPPA